MAEELEDVQVEYSAEEGGRGQEGRQQAGRQQAGRQQEGRQQAGRRQAASLCPSCCNESVELAGIHPGADEQLPLTSGEL